MSWRMAEETEIIKNLHQTFDKKTRREDVGRSLDQLFPLWQKTSDEAASALKLVHFLFFLKEGKFTFMGSKRTKSTSSGYHFWTPTICILVTKVFYFSPTFSEIGPDICDRRRRHHDLSVSHDFWVFISAVI